VRTRTHARTHARTHTCTHAVRNKDLGGGHTAILQLGGGDGGGAAAYAEIKTSEFKTTHVQENISVSIHAFSTALSLRHSSMAVLLRLFFAAFLCGPFSIPFLYGHACTHFLYALSLEAISIHTFPTVFSLRPSSTAAPLFPFSTHFLYHRASTIVLVVFRYGFSPRYAFPLRPCL
jgi:hypothetical protein